MTPTREACADVQAYLTELRRERDRLAEQDRPEAIAVNDRILRVKRQIGRPTQQETTNG